MIVSFGDSATSDLYHGNRTAKVRALPPEVLKGALRKLDLLHAAARLEDLKVPPGNRLEPLKGSLSGYYSIRVNDQWRIIFKWDQGAHEVKFTDYH